MNRSLALTAAVAFTAAAASFALAQPSPAPLPQAPPVSAPPVTPAPTPAAATTPTPAATTTPTSAASTPPATAVPSPSPSGVVYRFTATPSSAPGVDVNAPRILRVDVNDETLHAPGPIAFRILTSPNVTTVIAKVMGREVAIPQVGSGVFAASGELPGVPFFLYGRHRIDIVAAAADGKTAQTSVTLRLAH